MPRVTMQVGADTLIQLLGFAAMAGAAWWRLRHVESALAKQSKAISEMRDELRGDINENNTLIREQNGRIGRLERWRERREGFREGWDERGMGTG